MGSKNSVFPYFLPLSLLFLPSCFLTGNDDDDLQWGEWIEISSFEGIPRSNAIAFSINGKGYVGTGFDGSDPMQDFWEYDPDLNSWFRKADFPGIPRSAAVGFSINGMGYIGTGYNADVGDRYLKDFWRYDPTTNAWEQIADFGGSARYAAVAFAIDGRGYVGTGNDGNDLKDFWEYDPASNEWTQILSFPGKKRLDAVGFVVDGKGYVGTGRNNGVYEADFYAYDPATGLWTRMRDLDEDSRGDPLPLPRGNAVAFALKGKGYFSLGERSGLRRDVWEYDPSIDHWTQVAAFEALARQGAVAFTHLNKAFVGTGTNGTFRFDDVWEFDPTVLVSD